MRQVDEAPADSTWERQDAIFHADEMLHDVAGAPPPDGLLESERFRNASNDLAILLCSGALSTRLPGIRHKAEASPKDRNPRGCVPMSTAAAALRIDASEVLQVALHSQHPSGEYYFTMRNVDDVIMVGSVPKDML